MSTINRLSSVDVLQPSDQIPVWDSSNGDTRKASMSTLLAFVESYFADPDYSTRIVAPAVDYFTVDIGATGDSIWMIVNPTLNFTNGAITLPPATSAVNDQQITVVFTSSVSTFVITSSGATVLGAPTQINGYDSFSVRYNSAQQTWYNIGTTGSGSGTGVSQIVRQDFTGDGTTTTFALLNIPSALGNELQIFIDGVYQERSGYTVSGVNIIFSEAPPVLSNIEVLGWAVSIGAETSANLVSYTPAGTGAVLTTVQAKLRESVSVKDFGAVGDGVTDDTAAIDLAIAYGMSGGHVQVVFPKGSYSVSMISIVNPAYNFSIHSDGAEFIANASIATAGVFDLVNCYGFDMTGAWHINVGGNVNYAAGVSVRSQAGGNNSSSRNSIYNITIRQAKIGISVGVYNIDLACSELVFYGAKFFQCPVAVYNSGAETGCSFVGSDIISEPFGGYGGSPERAIWIEGGFVTVVGGSVVKANTSTPQAILFNPANGASSNPYGLLRISGAHIETSCQLITVSNPRALSTPASTNSNITLVGVGGYAGLSGAEDFITVSDATYTGTIEVTSSNFYAPSARSAFNMSAAGALVKFVTDKTSFGTNFLQWPKGVSAGIRVDNTYPISNIGATVTGVAAATAIYTLLGSSLGTLVVVQGSDATTNHYFVELVVFGNGGSAVVVGGGTVFGADVARTYSVVGTALRLAMGSGTYSVRCVPFEFYA